jgi:molybdopterin synthase catalytic subunit
MTVDISLQTEPLDLAGGIAPGAGALVRFEGRVRPHENDGIIEALDYEAYQPMAQKQMEKLARELGRVYPCLSVRVRHRVGRVAVGEAAILIEVCATHRAEAFALASQFMDRVKQEVPIWKSAAAQQQQ